MDALTIHEAAETTGWSARMLRYIEQAGLVECARSAAGYRLYGPPQLQRLRTLRELLAHGGRLEELEQLYGEQGQWDELCEVLSASAERSIKRSAEMNPKS